MKYIIFDTETTGLRKMAPADWDKCCSLNYEGDSVIEFGAVLVREDASIVKSVCLFNDCITAGGNPKAMSVNGLSLQEIRRTLSGVTLERNLATFFPEFFDTDVCYLGWNTPYDIALVSQTVRNYRIMPKVPQHMDLRSPKTGPCFVDVCDFYNTIAGGKKRRQRLVDASSRFATDIAEIFSRCSKSLITNSRDLFEQNEGGCHSALYDAVATYVLWRERVWPIWI